MLKESLIKSKPKIHPDVIGPYREPTGMFLHYQFPIFVFKYPRLAEGSYEFPFIFTLSDLKYPSIEYDNKKFVFYLQYKLKA